MLSYPKISVVILNWNGWRDTIECLESVYKNDYLNYDVIVVDNGSEDDSIQQIKEYAQGKIKIDSHLIEYSSNNKPIKVFEVYNEESDKPDFSNFTLPEEYHKLQPQNRLILIKNSKNLGYALGNNVGIAFSLDVLGADYVFILNNDTVVKSDILSRFIDFIESIKSQDQRIGMVGPKIFYYYKPNVVWFRGSVIKWCLCDLPTIKGSSYPREVDILSGCAQFISADFLRKSSIRGYNPTYPPGYDNLEICLRAKLLGYKIYYLPSAEMWHKVGRSRIKVEKYAEKFVQQWKHRGINGLKFRKKMFTKYYSGPKICKFLLNITCFTYIPLKQIVQVIRDKRNPSTVRGIIRGHIVYIKHKLKR